jgi:choline dehydrogenase-like flavoprotein
MGHGLSTGRLSPDERWIVVRIAEVATPPGRILPPPGGDTADALERLLEALGPAAAGFRAALRALDLAAVVLEGARLSDLPFDRRLRALERLAESEASFALVRAVIAPLKIVRVDACAPLERALGAEPRVAGLPIAPERPRWEAQMTDARALGGDVELEVDCVVVGSGAGGAPVAARLAARGHAVLVLEEGGYYTRRDFQGRPLAMQRKLYRDHGLTLALGNVVVPVPLGCTVGGSTTVNSGTCYRTPSDVLRRWQLELGLHALAHGALDPHFEAVERMLEVAVSPPEVLGGVARVIARGCEALGWAHAPLARNAPGCDARGLCCFGCPTDAKRGTNLTYIPHALRHGARLFYHARVERVLLEGRRAVGVEAWSVGGERRHRIAVRARTVVLACGAIHTPALLLANGLANASGQVGRNLTIHPAGYAWARFEEPIRGWEEVPQGYAVEEFAALGIRFEGGFVPLALAAGTLAPLGPRWTEIVEHFDRMAIFGFMIAERSRGRVWLGPRGEPRIAYRLCADDVRTIVRAQAILARIYFAAGAVRVMPGIHLVRELRDLDDVERFEREAPDRVRAHHLDLTAYHPLGTCRMGADPRRSVVSPEHETHDVEHLFVCDASAVPGPLGVNPQITIMALAERATAFVERRIEGRLRPAAPRPAATEIVFEETMSGTLTLAPDDHRVAASFTVRARADADLRRVWDERGGTLALEGTVSIPRLATKRPCRGTLWVRPLRGRGTVVYDLSFESDQGARCTLHGEKHAPMLSPFGMTRLHTEVRREGELFGRGILRFEFARHFLPWLASFRWGTRPADPPAARGPGRGAHAAGLRPAEPVASSGVAAGAGEAAE